MIKKLIITFFCFFSTFSFAQELNFTVVNLSKSMVFFKSTDYFDFGTAINFNETQTHIYKYAPKNMILSISNGPYSSFYIMTDPSCDELGFQPFRHMTKISASVHSSSKRYKAGSVYITISDMDGSTVLEKKIMCSITKSF